ncbi:hypothetical protein IWZ01DRAFT_126852 [Phyllosticta capitalensis]
MAFHNHHHLSSLLLAIVFLLQLPLTTGTPVPGPLAARHHGKSTTNPLTRLALPSSSLPSPASNLTLYAVTLGLGTQNYSCVDLSSSDEPTAVGAVASLYDISAVLENALMGATMEMALPGLALGVWGLLGGDGDGDGDGEWRKKRGVGFGDKERERDRAWEHVASNLPTYSGSSGGTSSSSSASIKLLQPMGHHFFSAAGVPSWALTLPSASSSVLFQGAKSATASAPTDASKGLVGEAAVAWLYLTRTAGEIADAVVDDDAGTGGVEAVYRVVTAGGSAPDTCEGWEGQDREVAYAAEYWFYGR